MDDAPDRPLSTGVPAPSQAGGILDAVPAPIPAGTSVTGTRWQLAAVEVAGLAGLLVFDEVMGGRFGMRREAGGVGTAIVVVAAALALVRRWRPDRLVPVAAAVSVLSIVHSGAAAAAPHTGVPLPIGFSLTEMTARLPARRRRAWRSRTPFSVAPRSPPRRWPGPGPASTCICSPYRPP
jgi:hypothetical protein